MQSHAIYMNEVNINQLSKLYFFAVGYGWGCVEWKS